MELNIEGDLLSSIYNQLDYESGELVSVTDGKSEFDEEEYLSKGQWIDTCLSINEKSSFKIDKVFFVQNNPVIVFVNAAQHEKHEIFKVYNSIWSLARPRIVFIENDYSVSIFDLAADPAKSNSELKRITKSVSTIAEIREQLVFLNREAIESGQAFGDARFESSNKRADHSLINDLKKVRKKLFDHGLKGDYLKYAHALIGRSIFIRYLEDRGVLTTEYFQLAAKNNKRLLEIINTPLSVSFYREEMRDLIFPRILANRELTFNLFKKIAKDFNGDTFETDDLEETVITDNHLLLLQHFLIGSSEQGQASLFLWAYRFDVIPIDLISSIYEEFYHSENLIDKKTQKLRDGRGTHYTPSSLVEFSLSRVLTFNFLKTNPRIIDPACGSGIFLVESFRRMVRYHLYTKRKKFLELEELLDILKNQIAGIEINPEAIKIAAFSLYLSLLHYLNPPSILDYIKKGGKLPYLIYHGKREINHFNILLESNSFDDHAVKKVFPNAFDCVVGNPPWGTPSVKDFEARKILKTIEEWCKAKNLEFPDKEPSHAFIWKAIDLVNSNGKVALLVSSGVLFKFSESSNKYKQQLFQNNKLEEVINFSHVRDVFFSGAISPFILLNLRKCKPTIDYDIQFVSLKQTENIDKNQIIVIDSTDVKSIPYNQIRVNDIWKIFYWGNRYDFELISSLRRFHKLANFSDTKISAQGFKEANKSKKSDWLKNFKEIPVEYLDNKFESINLRRKSDQSKLVEVPKFVEARGKKELYQGKRILIRRGILQKTDPKGQIISRLETDAFSFRHSIICIKLSEENEFLYEIVTATLWSSLFRYYMFMTASTWGTWRQEIHLNEVLEFPIALPDEKQRKKIKDTFESLKSEQKSLRNKSGGFLEIGISKELYELEKRLDDLIFDLYKLTDFEKNLIRERCSYDIDIYYNGYNSYALEQINKTDDLRSYIEYFKNVWQKNIEKDETFQPSIISPNGSSMLAVVFKLIPKDLLSIYNVFKGTELNTILGRIEDASKYPLHKRVFIQGITRSTSDDEIVIIKRNQKRLWSKVEAKADADATLLSAISKSSL
jgi:type I restriction-modification system DNA methylase subunit